MKNLLLVTALTVLPLSYGHAQVNAITKASANANITADASAVNRTGKTGVTADTDQQLGADTGADTGVDNSDIFSADDEAASADIDTETSADAGTSADMSPDTKAGTDTELGMDSDVRDMTPDTELGATEDMGTQTLGAAEQQPGTGFTVNEIEGRSVISENGEQVATIDSVVADKATGDMFAVVRKGGFFGMGGDKRVVPLNDLAMNEQDQVILRGNNELSSYNRLKQDEYNTIGENIQVNINKRTGVDLNTESNTGAGSDMNR